jgi:hypothetical protein
MLDSLVFSTTHPEQTKQWIRTLSAVVERVEHFPLPEQLAESIESSQGGNLKANGNKQADALSIRSMVSDASESSVASRISGVSFNPEPMVHPYAHGMSFWWPACVC